MQLAGVVGHGISTVKHPSLQGWRLLVVQPLTPDEKELWVTDGANNRIHVFDATVMPPKQVTAIKLQDMPDWVTFSIDGRYHILRPAR